MGIRSRLVTTSLLAVVALGGAGLAVAADGQSRQDTTWAADLAAQPWVGRLADEVAPVDAATAAIEQAGRQVLGSAEVLDFEAMRVALASGGARLAELRPALDRLAATNDQARQAIADRGMSPANADAFDRIDRAVDSAADVDRDWAAIEARADVVTGLVDSLRRHDEIVFRATTSGRDGDWQTALGALDEATAALDTLRRERDALSATVTVTTLNGLIDRYAAYADALANLYRFEAQTGRTSGTSFDALVRAVERTQAALPDDQRAMIVIVAEAAGPGMTRALAALSGTRQELDDALTAVAVVTVEP